MTAADNPQMESKPLIEHIIDLRRCLLWSFAVMMLGMAVCYMFVEDIYGFLVTPLAQAMGPESTGRLIYTGLAEAFFTYLKVAFFAGVFLTFPVLCMQIWRFVAPGLYQKERSAFLPYLVATPMLFFSGGAFVYYVVLPMAWPFFLGFQSSAAETVLPVQLEARVGEYLDLVMLLIFAFGVCFQMPVVFSLLGRAGILTAQMMRQFRRYAIVVIFIIAAIITPPDVISQFSLAVPMMLLYELSILLVQKVSPHARNPA